MSKRNKSITDEMIIEMYLSGVSVNEIAKRAGITPTGVTYIRNKHGIKAIRSAGQPRKHKVNEDFFKVWTHEMAWVLGLFVTDGAVSKSSHSITFAQKDERILKLIAKYMEADYILTPFGKTKTTPSIVINSREIKQDLEMMGIKHNKSMTLPFPKVPEEYLPSFIRGVIDGDGYVDKKGYVVTITTGSSDFAEGLLNVFQKWVISARIRCSKNKNNTSFIYRIVISGKGELIKLSKVIYNNVSTDHNFVIYKRVYLSQHSNNPFIVEDTRKNKAWSITKNNTLLFTSNNRRSVKTYISNSLIEKLKTLASEKNTSVNYLLEPFLEQLVETQINLVSVKVNDRREFRTTFNETLLEKIKAYGLVNNIKINTIFEYCMRKCLEENGHIK